MFRNQEKKLLSSVLCMTEACSSSVDLSLAQILNDFGSVKESSSGSLCPAEIAIALLDIVASQVGLGDAAKAPAT